MFLWEVLRLKARCGLLHTSTQVADYATLPDGQLLVLIEQKCSAGVGDCAWVYKNVNDVDLEPVVQIPPYICSGENANGLEALEDFTFALACRDGYMLTYWAMDGTVLFGFLEDGLANGGDAFSVRQGPRGLLYLSDFTGERCNHPAVSESMTIDGLGSADRFQQTVGVLPRDAARPTGQLGISEQRHVSGACLLRRGVRWMS